MRQGLTFNFQYTIDFRRIIFCQHRCIDRTEKCVVRQRHRKSFANRLWRFNEIARSTFTSSRCCWLLICVGDGCFCRYRNRFRETRRKKNKQQWIEWKSASTNVCPFTSIIGSLSTTLSPTSMRFVLCALALRFKSLLTWMYKCWSGQKDCC